MSPRCDSFVRIRALIARLERSKDKAERKRASQARRELHKVAAELTEAEQDWLKRFLAEEAEG